MQEDKLDKDERLRLEALNQAVHLNIGVAISDEQIIMIARRFERYIRNGNDEGGER